MVQHGKDYSGAGGLHRSETPAMAPPLLIYGTI
jgi:hypothetical protein